MKCGSPSEEIKEKITTVFNRAGLAKTSDYSQGTNFIGDYTAPDGHSQELYVIPVQVHGKPPAQWLHAELDRQVAGVLGRFQTLVLLRLFVFRTKKRQSQG